MATPENAHTHTVSKEDVGHETTSTARHDGFARRTRLKTFKTKHDRTTRKTNNGQSSSEGGDSTEEEDGSDNEEESSDKGGDETETEEPENYAPSGSTHDDTEAFSRLDSIMNDTSAEMVDSSSHNHSQAGQVSHIHPPFPNKKRTYSELSSNTVVSTTDKDAEQRTYPRKKVQRRLSSGKNGLLQYDDFLEAQLDDDFAIEEYEDAIKSSDEEEQAYDIDQVDESQDSDVERLEELMIIKEEESGDIGDESAESNSDNELLSDVGLDFLDAGADEFFLDQTIESDVDIKNHEVSTNVLFVNGRKQSDGSAKRVRFARSSSGSSSDTDLDIFPDLLEQESLPALLRTDIERDIDLDTGNLTGSDGSSCWDFGEDQASKSFFHWHDVHTESESEGTISSGRSFSGYDSDGDTTDDDLPPPATVRAPKSLLHRRSPSSANSVIHKPKPFPRSRRSAKGPVLGSFIVDQQKAMAFIDPNTKQLRIQRARSPFVANPFLDFSTGSSATNSPKVAFQGLAFDGEENETQLFTGPSDVMMSGVFGGPPGQRYQNGRFVVEAAPNLMGLMGPPEAFFPFTSFRSDGSPETDEEDDYLTDDEFDDDIDLTAFLEMGERDEDDDEEGEELEEDENTSPTTTDAAESIPTHNRNMSQTMIKHFDRGVVNSFRNNQDRYRTISRLPHDFSSLSAPVRNGKTAEALITPPRKRKSSITHEKTPHRFPILGGFR